MMKIVCSATLLKEVLSSSLGSLNPLVDEIGYHLLPDVTIQLNEKEISIEFPLFSADGDPKEDVHGYFGTILDLRGWKVSSSEQTCELEKVTGETRITLKSFGCTPKGSILFSVDDYAEWSQEPKLLSRPEKFLLGVYTLFGIFYPYIDRYSYEVGRPYQSSSPVFEVTDLHLRNVGDADVLKARIKEKHGDGISLIRNSVLATIFS